MGGLRPSAERVKKEIEMKIDQQQADDLVQQLSGAIHLLERGRAFGIRVVATDEAIAGLLQSSHPDTQRIVSNIKLDNEAAARP